MNFRFAVDRAAALEEGDSRKTRNPNERTPARTIVMGLVRRNDLVNAMPSKAKNESRGNLPATRCPLVAHCWVGTDSVGGDDHEHMATSASIGSDIAIGALPKYTEDQGLRMAVDKSSWVLIEQKR